MHEQDHRPTDDSPDLSTAVAAIGAATGDLADAAAIRRMAQHWLLVAEANAQHNLTGIRDVAVAAQMHYRDACLAAKLLVAGDLVDFGSGAGYPGLVFAALDPTRTVALVEPRRLRVAFLREASERLGFARVTVHACKVQASPPQQFANAVCRAVFSDDRDLAAAAAWLVPGGRLLSFRAAGAGKSHRQGQLERTQSVHYEVGGSARRVDVWVRSA